MNPLSSGEEGTKVAIMVAEARATVVYEERNEPQVN